MHLIWQQNFYLYSSKADRFFYFQNKKKYFKKLTRTSYVNKKDHWLLFLKNPAQIRR